MEWKYPSGEGWKTATLKQRHGDGWAPFAAPAAGTGAFSWDQTFTDTSWLFEADASGDLNVEVVDNLDFEGSGGLEEAVDNAGSDPTVVVFEVGGVIEVPGHNWRCRESEIWFAGETAPWPGIAITQCRTRFHDPRVIVSHMSFLQGDEGLDGYDSTVDLDADDVILDHCTCAMATEENIGVPNEIHRPSVINTIIAEGLFDNPHHSSTRARGFLVNDENCTEMTHLGCLYAHNQRRHPLTRSDMIMCNNYIYNYSNVSGGGNIINFNSPGHPDITAKGLYFEEGPDTGSGYDRPIFSYSAELYAEDIERPSRHPLSDGDQNMLDDPPLVPDGLDIDEDILPSEEVPAFVTTNVGPRPAERPPYEEGLINDRVGDGQGGLIDEPDDVGGYPDYDATSHSLNVPSSGIVDWVKREYTQPAETSS